jgi:hypothetical protein
MRSYTAVTPLCAYALLLYLVAGSLGAAAASYRNSLDRSLLVTTEPDGPPVTQVFDSSLKRASPDIQADDPRILKAAAGCAVPEQVG